MTDLLDTLRITHPIVQAPMAGVATPALAAEVSNAGALGSIGVGATDAQGAAQMITELQGRTEKPFNVNLFVHRAPQADSIRETAWLAAMAPVFAGFGSGPPETLKAPYQSFATDDAMLRVLLDLAPAVISFHFGLPDPARVAALKQAGCVLLSTVTSLAEAGSAREAGMDAIVAQGVEAGGHRGIFDPTGRDDRLETRALVQALVPQAGLPVIAAGGLMDGHDIAQVLALGAGAAQLGTAFVGCPESSADAAYRAALAGEGAQRTVLTDAISGRPARCLGNRMTDWADRHGHLPPPDYPIAYDAAKALNTAARAADETGFAAQWAGQGAPRARFMPAAALIGVLLDELAGATQG